MTQTLQTTTDSKWSGRYIWDIETDGLIPDVSVVWCLGVTDIETGEQELFTNYDPSKRSLEDGLRLLSEAREWAGHNLRGYDIPVLEQLGLCPSEPGLVTDTLLASQVLYPDIKRTKFKHRVPSKISWSHSLKAWGHRVGSAKIEYDDWSRYTPEMGTYCLQDTRANLAVYRNLQQRAGALGLPWDTTDTTGPLWVEHEFKRYVMWQERNGFTFNVEEAHKLAGTLLAEKDKIDAQLQEAFPPITETIHYVTPKKKLHKTKEVTTVFNPCSRQQVGSRLMSLGWEPGSFTDKGQPQVNETTMADAAEEYPAAELISRYLQLDKRLGAIINGDNAWVRLERKGKIHGQVNTMGTITTRVTHNGPNLSQVPSVGKYLGEECRSLFSARPGWVLIGADLSGIELRCLAHYLWHWDDGAYSEHVLNGDVHTVHQQAFGLPPGKKWRSIGKQGTYCMNYGGGDWKLGWTLKARGTETQVAAAGKKFRASLMHSIPALNKLVSAVKAKRKRGNAAGKECIRGIAGHPLLCRSEHSALNTLLQSAGAQVAKRWYVLFHIRMEALGYVYGEQYGTVGFFHDEVQVECEPALQDVVGALLQETALEAGRQLGMRVPTDADYSIGRTWADTH